MARARGARDTDDIRFMVRVAQMYYRMHLTQEEIGNRLGLSRFKVGRLLDRAVRESIVRIEVVHPAARLVSLEDALVERFGLRGAVVVDVPAANGQTAEELAREAVARAAVTYLTLARPSGSIGVSWGRTMFELARHLQPGWTNATEIVQLNGATSRSPRPTGAYQIAERFGATTGATIRLLAAPAIVGSSDLRIALTEDPTIGETLDAARAAPSAIFGLGIVGRQSVLVESGSLSDEDVANLAEAGAVGDVIGRFLTQDGRIASQSLDDRTIGLPVVDLTRKSLALGLAAGAGRGPIALAALRAKCVNVLAADEGTADWVLEHG
jgi:deoxyribonucleoside regulator